MRGAVGGGVGDRTEPKLLGVGKIFSIEMNPQELSARLIPVYQQVYLLIGGINLMRGKVLTPPSRPSSRDKHGSDAFLKAGV